MALQSLDIIRRSATTTPSPGERTTQEVVKLIDVSKCIGCKACQVACMEWNDTRDAVGTNHGVYDNPADLTADSWTVMRYAEVETERGLEWLIRKDGYIANTLTPFVGDANVQSPEFKSFLVNIEKA